MVTTFNPGAAGPRYVAGHLMENGHDAKFFHVKELRAVAIPTTDFEKHESLNRFSNDVQFIAIQHPGEILYVPYPTAITDQEIDLFIAELKSYDPHIVGISMFSVTVNIARRLTRIIHERLPGLPVIWGGIHCMVHPETCLEGLRPHPVTGETNPLQVPDIVCVTEGEYPMTELMDRWDEYIRGEIPDVAGLWFVKGTEVTKFNKKPFESNLDNYALPVYAVKEVLIDDDKLDHKFEDPKGFIQNHIYVFTERGCPYSCSFCIHSTINKMDEGYSRIRRRTVAHVMGEIEKRIEENNLKHFILHDEIFAIQKKWIMEFADEWEKRFTKYGITFTGYVHPIATDEEMVDRLFEVGMSRTGIAIQTGSVRTSKLMYDRPLHREKIIRMSEYVSKHAFDLVQVEVITDSAYELDEDRRDTLMLLLDMKPTFYVETFGLQTYSTSELANKKRLMEEVPWNERLFWNMLYHLTGNTFINRDTILGLSNDPHMRENPLLLEQLVIDLKAQYYRSLKGQMRFDEENKLVTADKSAKEQYDPQREMVLEMRRRSQAYNGAEGSIEEEKARRNRSVTNPVGQIAEGEFSGYRFKRLVKESIKKLLNKQ
jgi:radical SAM superfamily enzyme YgiQ (UPF0313 family)